MKTFLIVWPDHREHMRTPEFKEEFDQVIEALRSDRYEGKIGRASCRERV